jgi:flagellar hook assembly protein FlgD
MAGRLQVRVYGVDGRLVAYIADSELGTGRNTVVWDKTNTHGSPVPSGIYLVRGSLEVGGRIVAQAGGRIAVLK